MIPENSIPSWRPHGKAIWAFWKGEKEASIGILMDDGEEVFMPASIYFRAWNEMPELEKIALQACKGKVLDVGAGAGAHSLVLSKNHKVDSIDIDPIGVEIMQARGLSNAKCEAFLQLNEESKYDTLLFLMNGIGIAESIEGLKNYLKKAKNLLNTKGQIILDSSDLRISNPELEAGGNYFGEISYQLSYQYEYGSPYNWLYIDFETLSQIAANLAWNSEKLYESEDGSYLAKLWQ